jgi:hypothetical protein
MHIWGGHPTCGHVCAPLLTVWAPCRYGMHDPDSPPQRAHTTKHSDLRAHKGGGGSRPGTARSHGSAPTPRDRSPTRTSPKRGLASTTRGGAGAGDDLYDVGTFTRVPDGTYSGAARGPGGTKRAAAPGTTSSPGGKRAAGVGCWGPFCWVVVALTLHGVSCVCVGCGVWGLVLRENVWHFLLNRQLPQNFRSCEMSSVVVPWLPHA